MCMYLLIYIYIYVRELGAFRLPSTFTFPLSHLEYVMSPKCMLCFGAVTMPGEPQVLGLCVDEY